jgi:ribonuclease HI
MWIKTWKKNGWKTSSNKMVKNKVDIQFLDFLATQIEIKWVNCNI